MTKGQFRINHNEGVPREECERINNLIMAAPELLEALEAIQARINGDFDNPSLLKFGTLDKLDGDCGSIASAAIAKAWGQS